MVNKLNNKLTTKDGLPKDRPVLTKKQINDQNLDLNDLTVIDSFNLSKTNYSAGLIKGLLFTAVAILIFFIPITYNGKTDMVFGIIYNFLSMY